MPDEISLLPEEHRKKEEDMKKAAEATPKPPGELKFSVPKEETEDVEVIEIDEGDVSGVLQNEPLPSRLFFKLTSGIQELKEKLFHVKAPEPPPKLPPQFFTPPVKPAGTPTFAKPLAPGEVAKPAVASAPKAVIKPFQSVPKRVRVIKRVRKPVRVSFVSEDDLRSMRINISKRKFTFGFMFVLGGLLLGGSAYVLNQQADASANELAKVDSQIADVRSQIKEKQTAWSAFQDLEPKLKSLAQLLKAHVVPTRLFDLIEKHTIPTVYYQSLSLSTDRRVTLQAVADTFQSAAEQVATMQQASFVTKVEASGYTAMYDPPGAPQPKFVEFQMVLTLTPDALQIPSGMANAQ